MISVVLNVYKRPHLLEKQIEAVLNQSIPVIPTDIHVWYNMALVDQPDPSDVRIKTYRCNWNTKFHGRFTIPLLCRSEYVAMFDDDNIPGERWFENCLNTINTDGYDGILGGVGVVIGKNGTHNIGWNGDHNESVARVDYIGQSWFFRQEAAKYMWYEKPHTWDNGEDIMFCYLAQKYGGLNTFVPPHPNGKYDLWSTDYDFSYKHGRDNNASWRIPSHRRVRHGIHVHCIQNGWETVNNIQL